MFDIGFWELVLLAIIGLLVVGPDKLPGFAREAGRWLRRLRRLTRDARRELERELELDDDHGTGDLGKRLRHMDRLMKEAPDRQPDYRPQYPDYGPPETPAQSGTGSEPVHEPGTEDKTGSDRER